MQSNPLNRHFRKDVMETKIRNEKKKNHRNKLGLQVIKSTDLFFCDAVERIYIKPCNNLFVNYLF